MTMKHYINPAGDFFATGYGSFSEGNPNIPQDAIEVPLPPQETGLLWSGSDWVWTKQALKDHLADYRWQKEVGGLVFSGLSIRTDERSRALLSGIQKQIDTDNLPARTRKVKTSSGFYDISDAALSALYAFVVAHVQKCFDCEFTVLADIENNTITTKGAVEAAFDAAYNA
jgi:hypothetical protein